MKSVEPAISWTATLQFASEQWLSNRVPSKFMRDTIKSARKEFRNALDGVDQSDAPKPLRDSVKRWLVAADVAATYEDTAITLDYRQNVVVARGTFSRAYAELDDMRKRIEK